jgi:hypothetical protein
MAVTCCRYCSLVRSTPYMYSYSISLLWYPCHYIPLFVPCVVFSPCFFTFPVDPSFMQAADQGIHYFHSRFTLYKLPASALFRLSSHSCKLRIKVYTPSIIASRLKWSSKSMHLVEGCMAFPPHLPIRFWSERGIPRWMSLRY